MSFEIAVTNIGSTTINNFAVTDYYSTTYLAYLGSANPASDDNIDDGDVEWTNLPASFGAMTPGKTVTLTVSFHANAPTGANGTRNCAAVAFSVGQMLYYDQSCVDVVIQAQPPRIEVD